MDLPADLNERIDALVERRVNERLDELLSPEAVHAQVDELVASKRFWKRFRREIDRSRLTAKLLVGRRERVSIDPEAAVKAVMMNTSSGSITIERGALVDHFVCLLTGTHDVEQIGPGRRSGVPDSGRDITVGEGAWLATGAIVIGPCTIGAHAVVAAGAVVTRDVPPWTIVGGNPARPLGTVGPDGDRPERSNGRSRESAVVVDRAES